MSDTRYVRPFRFVEFILFTRISEAWQSRDGAGNLGPITEYIYIVPTEPHACDL